MRQFILALVLFVLSFAMLPTVALAEPPVYAQQFVQVEATAEVGAKMDVGMFSAALIAPDSDPLYLSYIGPGFQATAWWWTSLRTGLALNLPGSAPIFSWWNVLAFPWDVSVFAEADFYPFLDSPWIYYGFYTADKEFKRFNVGVQGEQINKNINFGPHIMIPLGDHMLTGAEYYVGLGDELKVIRLILRLRM